MNRELELFVAVPVNNERGAAVNSVIEGESLTSPERVFNRWIATRRWADKTTPKERDRATTALDDDCGAVRGTSAMRSPCFQRIVPAAIPQPGAVDGIHERSGPQLVPEDNSRTPWDPVDIRGRGSSW